jgi:general secretion pathway protein N
MPAMPGGGIGAVLGPGSAPRMGGGLHSATPSALPRPRLSEAPAEPVPSDLNPLAAILPPLRAARERPLFSPSRRPPRPAPALAVQVVAPVAAPPPPAPALRLIGIVQDAENAAGIVRRGTGQSQVLRAGDPVDGWSVAEIGPEHLTLRLGDQVQTYRLFAATPPGPRPRPTPRQGER